MIDLQLREHRYIAEKGGLEPHGQTLSMFTKKKKN